MAIAKRSARKSAPAAKPAPKPAPKAAPAKKPAAGPVETGVKTVTAMSVLKQLSDAFDALNEFKAMGGFDGVAFAAAKPAAAEGTAAETPKTLDEEKTRALSITQLRALAVELGLDEQKVKSGILTELEENGYFESDEDAEDDEDEDDVEEDDDSDDEDEDEDDEDEDEDDEDEEDEDYTREELEEMDLKALRAVAKEDGHKLADYKSLDQEGLISLILGEDEDDEDDDEEEELDEDQLRAMPLDELKSLAKELGVKVPRNVKQPVLVELILDAAPEDDEE